MFSGKLFHSAGPASEMARLPRFRLENWMAKSPFVAERRPFLDGRAEHDVTMDDKYDGARPALTWNMRRQTLKERRA